ncbi:MAG TPA: response regulator transcription factor [Bacilli bacterium]|jgi:two-component system alkaline phosphatase synthesis response regulator PhoP|nr:response regulator transcription factor [Acholeplasmataceae bacterium]HNZ77894.1 response regulator transcription factor [Bacilli bacterium]HOD60963.1 response regulator transcription factor [Bacilli bacterium]HOE06930.1 response regulator transcription factor [Bacilli bacterium]HOH62035.1 response regulator transcription factor [Bacilli bacterium]
MKELIYFVEDDENIAELLEATLSLNGYRSKGFFEPLAMLKDLATTKPDLIILDLMLPNMNGYDVLKYMKKNDNLADIPVIILSAKSSELDIVKGLDLGASDYMTKPFGILELSSRIKANLGKMVKKSGNEDLLVVRELQLDESKHQCTLRGEIVKLTVTEYEIVKVLMKNKGVVMTRNKLLNMIWGYENLAETRTLDMHIKSIREKFSKVTMDIYIETVRGIGYIIN